METNPTRLHDKMDVSVSEAGVRNDVGPFQRRDAKDAEERRGKQRDGQDAMGRKESAISAAARQGRLALPENLYKL